MVAGHLEKKAGKYYCVISYKNLDGKRDRKWIPTGLSVKGNKRRAEEKLSEIRRTFKPPIVIEDFNSKMLLVDYLSKWLDVVKNKVSGETYHNYTIVTTKKVIPYYMNTGLKLDDVKRKHIQDFVNALASEKKYEPSTIKTYYLVLHSALRYAEKMELISTFPCKFIELPSFRAHEKTIKKKNFYSEAEINYLLKMMKGNRYEVPVILASFLGLRRGEVLGLKWSSIDFDKKTITIKHAIKQEYSDDHRKIIGVKGEDRLKTDKSARVLPLIESLERIFVEIREAQEYNKKICGSSYNKKFFEYICVDSMGNLITPGNLSAGFSYYIKKYDLPKISFHGLRHSCASLLINNGYELKVIQEFLGHSNYNITANLYAHVDKEKIINAGNTINGLLVAPEYEGAKDWK
ncbi:tyrosine-type recombinase/integrase [Eubacterium limosum]|uniref:tyrosine-type recombinase/integrase n=1 Tax=Eubacterium limosum TaxID=1736 RepID=UPI0010624830|nr:site-specific integrase [Eubacterium limosum]